MTLNFEQLKAASTLKTVSVEVPEFSGSLTLRQLDGRRGLTVFRNYPQGEDETGEAMARFYVELIACSVIDDAGVLMLDTKDGRELVASWPFNVMSAVGAIAAELNGVTAKKND